MIDDNLVVLAVFGSGVLFIGIISACLFGLLSYWLNKRSF